MQCAIDKVVYRCDEDKKDIPKLLEGFLYGLGEVCHSLFGNEGEVIIYKAIGDYYIKYLKENMNISFDSLNPWDMYCEIIKAYTEYGFFSYTELYEKDDNSYYMLEVGQYAGQIWESQGSWDRGTAPCPLWSVILRSLERIGYTIVLDYVNYLEDKHGFESVFHFEKIHLSQSGDYLSEIMSQLRSILVPICSTCKKVNHQEEWVSLEKYFSGVRGFKLSHSMCPDCLETISNELSLKE